MKKLPHRATGWVVWMTLGICACRISLAQNVVSSVVALDVLPGEPLPANFARELVSANAAVVEDSIVRSDAAASRRIARKLDAHIRELIDGWPWRPLHHVLGISGFETYFDHPDELFYVLALAKPFLPPESQEHLVRFLVARLDETPPFSLEGFDRRRGSPRESYDVPESLRAQGRGVAHSLFGVGAFALFVAQLDENSRSQIDLAAYWKRIRERLAPLLTPLSAPAAPSAGDAEQLNGNLAGLLGAAQMAMALHDEDTLREIIAAVQQLAQRRVDIERTNPRFVEKTSMASKDLHNFKLTRYCALTPEVARCLHGTAQTLAAKRLRAFREMRPGWHAALGERLIGGENYTNPLHFDRALFAAAALIEELPADELLRFIDVPACKADFYFIEKCALALRARAR